MIIKVLDVLIFISGILTTFHRWSTEWGGYDEGSRDMLQVRLDKEISGSSQTVTAVYLDPVKFLIRDTPLHLINLSFYKNV